MTPTKSTSGQAAYTDMTDAALNRRVAERLGWRLEATAFPNLYATVINPDGYRTGTVKLASDGISHALVDGKWWDSWATSIDAAAALDFGDAIARVVVTLVKDGAKGEAHSAVNGRVIVDYFDPSESRMRTILWLMYKDWISAK